jgi:LacI family transcriptional regulator, repressor for deo operon, udp, cdd, tsx, nupC, and nupG
VGGADGGFTSRAGAAATTRLLDAAREGAARRPTAVFCPCDEIAFGALHALRQAGLRCPEDVSVIGLDDHELAATFDLSTVAQPVAEMGAAAARWLGVTLETDVPQPVEDNLHPVKLVTRGTTGPAPA